MFTSLKYQISLMLSQKNFKVCFTLMMLICTVCPCYYFICNIGNDVSTLVAPEYAYVLNFYSPFAQILAFLLPVIASIPFSNSYILDRELNIDLILRNKLGNTNYFVSKAITSAIAAFLVFLIPLIVNICINEIVFPKTYLDANGQDFGSLLYSEYIYSEEEKEYYSVNFFLYHPQFYNLSIAFLTAVYAAICGLTAFSVSFFVKRFRYFTCVPMMILSLLGNIGAIL
ncbi:MAG: hypothetical protein LBM93_01630, partial [Oscillospiraceae bacterium]|nr:hypothetical protein [Oscillospiraceae bacterium]